ncbi:MAG TPA: hypothetical protein VMZ91_04200 [Candidatus Paceibacterota bacterium]|nr:hypothetical protein [Candidatus Paceibacterota bacterium]
MRKNTKIFIGITIMLVIVLVFSFDIGDIKNSVSENTEKTNISQTKNAEESSLIIENNCPEKLQLETYTSRAGFYGAFSEDYNKAKDGTGLDIDCRKGSVAGENVNYAYCSGFYREGDILGKVIDENGLIRDGDRWRTYFIVDLESIEYINKGIKGHREIYQVIEQTCNEV